MSRMCTHLNLQQPVLYAYGLFFFVHFLLIFGILISGGDKIEKKEKVIILQAVETQGLAPGRKPPSSFPRYKPTLHCVG